VHISIPMSEPIDVDDKDGDDEEWMSLVEMKNSSSSWDWAKGNAWFIIPSALDEGAEYGGISTEEICCVSCDEDEDGEEDLVERAEVVSDGSSANFSASAIKKRRYESVIMTKTVSRKPSEAAIFVVF